MKVLGIVVEYNPFHNGHIYHLEQSKAVTGCDAVVCVMSGNFIQRGEPAIINKFARAQAALHSGADLVIELPHPFAMASAEYFAYGAVKILDSIGIVDSICFGSEHGEIDGLKLISDILSREPETYKTELKKQLSIGLSFPVARQNAINIYLQARLAENANTAPDDNILSASLPQLLETSNNILGIEYLKALNKLGSLIKPMTIKRISNSYNNTELTGHISSATAIRTSILKGVKFGSNLTEETFISLPPASSSIIEREFLDGRGPVSIKQYEGIIFALLRKMTANAIRELPDVSEGLEYRIKNACEVSGTIEELIENISTKRYARTRIQRILLSALTGITKTDMELFMKYGGPQYARILGFNQTGRWLLSKMKKTSIIPAIMKTADFKTSCNSLLTRMLEVEAVSTDLYVLGYKNPVYRKAGQEYTQNISIIK